MPGRGPAPKDPSRRARRNKDPMPQRVLAASAAPQPELPGVFDWPEQTVAWWATWGASPLAAEFTADDWSFLLDTALLHRQMWLGDTKAAAELRLRVAKFGATPEDRLRLRVQFAAEPVDPAPEPAPASSARQRYSHLSVVDDSAVAGA